MTDSMLEWTVVILPTALGILGLLFTLKVPREATHRNWRYALLAAGIAISILTYLQQARSRESHALELKEQRQSVEKLQKIVEEAEAKRQVESAFLRERLDSKQLAALSASIREYAQSERAKNAPDNRQVRERALVMVRKMREFQLRYDFEQQGISARFLQGLDQAHVIGERELNAATSQLESDGHLTLEQQNELLQKKINVNDKRLAAIKAVGEKAIQEDDALAQRYAAEFRSSLLTEAAYLREEILKRLPAQPAPTETQAAEVLVFQGILTGSRAVNSAAGYLEKLAKKLPS